MDSELHSTGPLPSGLQASRDCTFPSHYVLFVSAIQLAGGVLLLVNRFVPLALYFLARDREHPFVSPALYRTGLLIRYCRNSVGILAFRHRQYFSGIFVHERLNGAIQARMCCWKERAGI